MRSKEKWAQLKMLEICFRILRKIAKIFHGSIHPYYMGGAAEDAKRCCSNVQIASNDFKFWATSSSSSLTKNQKSESNLHCSKSEIDHCQIRIPKPPCLTELGWPFSSFSYEAVKPSSKNLSQLAKKLWGAISSLEGVCFVTIQSRPKLSVTS